MAISLSGTGGFQTLINRIPKRPLAPLAVSSPTGQTSTVAAPTTARIPAGTMYPAPQQVAPKPNILPRAPSPAVPPAAPAPAPPPTVPGAQTANLTGQEAPFRVTPGQSATQGLQNSAVGAAQRALDNPSPYDDQLFQQEVSRGRESLDADIANRGLDYSTIAPQLFSSRVLQPLLSERARSIADARQQALQGAQGVIGQQTGLESQGRDELRTERGYSDQLREQARQNAIQQYQLQEGSFQSTIQQALASGDPSQALAALNRAASGYGDQAAGTSDQLSQLAQLFAKQFYGPQQAAA